MTRTAAELRTRIDEETARLDQDRAYRPSYATGPTRSERSRESLIKLLTEELAEIEAGADDYRCSPKPADQPPTDKQVTYLRALIERGKWTRINSSKPPTEDEIRAMGRSRVSYHIDQLKT